MLIAATRRATGLFRDLGELISSICDLEEQLAHCADACLVKELNTEAEILNVRFTKSVIASKSAFTYEEAQIRKDDP